MFIYIYAQFNKKFPIEEEQAPIFYFSAGLVAIFQKKVLNFIYQKIKRRKLISTNQIKSNRKVVSC